MMIEKTGKKCRNIQEQVQKNMEDIAKLKRRTPIDSFVQHLSTDEKTVLSIEQNVDGDYKPYYLYLGSNLAIIPDGQGNFTLSASGEISGTVNFVDILGEPTDNLKLKPYLDKIDRVPSLDEKNDWNATQTFNGTINYFNGDAGIVLWSSGRDSSSPWITARFTSRYINFHKEEEDAGSITLRYPYHLDEGSYTLMVAEEHTFANLLGKPEDNKALSEVLDNARKQIQSLETNKQDKATLDKDVAALGYIKNVPVDNLVTIDGDQTISGIKTFKYARFNETIDGTVHQATIHGNRIQHRYTVGTAFPSYEFLFPNRSGTLALKEDFTSPYFKDVAGNPRDNTALAALFDEKADKKSLDLYRTATAQDTIDNTIKADITSLQNNKADKTALEEKADKKQLDLYQPIIDNTLQTTAKNIPDAINEVNSKATGQVNAYTINAATAGNEPFNTTGYLIIASSFVDVNGMVHQSSELKPTDLIIVTNEGIPSRVYTGNNNFMRQATTPELQNYYTKEQTNNLLDSKVSVETLGKDVESAGFRNAIAQDAIDANKQDVISDLDTIRQDSLLGATAVQPEALDPINEHLDSHDKTISQAEVNIGNLQNQVGTLTETVGNHDTAITNMQGSISSLETALGDKADKKQLDLYRTSTDQDTIDNEIKASINNKQDVISDLGTIRSNAALGATAVQPATLTTELDKKQNVITTSLTLVFTLEDGTEETHELYSKE